MAIWETSQLSLFDMVTIKRAPAIDFSESDWTDVIEVNLSSVFRLSQAAAKHMIVARLG